MRKTNSDGLDISGYEPLGILADTPDTPDTLLATGMLHRVTGAVIIASAVILILLVDLYSGYVSGTWQVSCCD